MKFLCFLLVALTLRVSGERNNLKLKESIRCSEIHHSRWGFMDAVLTCHDKSSPPMDGFDEVEISSVVRSDNNQTVNNIIQIEGLWYQNVQMNTIPERINKTLPRLKAFAVNGAGLLLVEKRHLRQFGMRLIYVSFFNNSLTALESDLFEYNRDLQLVNFDRNPLTYIDPVFFERLKVFKSLEHIWFSNCGCINQSQTQTKKIARWRDDNCRDWTTYIDLSFKIKNNKKLREVIKMKYVLEKVEAMFEKCKCYHRDFIYK